jgi:hypothetical protein
MSKSKQSITLTQRQALSSRKSAMESAHRNNLAERVSAEEALLAPSLYPPRLEARRDNFVNSLSISVDWRFVQVQQQ